MDRGLWALDGGQWTAAYVFLLEQEAIHPGCTPADNSPGQVPAFKTHSPAAMGKALLPCYIIMYTFMAVQHGFIRRITVPVHGFRGSELIRP